MSDSDFKKVDDGLGIVQLALFVNVVEITYASTSFIGKDLMTMRGCSIMDFAFLRFGTILATAIVLMKINGKGPIVDLPPEHRCLMATRAISGTLGFTLVNLGIKFLPLSISTVVLKSSPFFTAIL
jgi:drug/metabolite transporter (DMT)-like permease